MFLRDYFTLGSNPAESFRNFRFRKNDIVNARFTESFDVVIYDAPLTTDMPEPQILPTKVEGVVMVVRQGYTRKEEVKKAKESLDNINVFSLGYVKNGKELRD